MQEETHYCKLADGYVVNYLSRVLQKMLADMLDRDNCVSVHSSSFSILST